MAINAKNLDPCRDKETAEARGKQGGIQSGIVRREKKLMTQIYAEFLSKEHDVVDKNGKNKKLSGNDFLSSVIIEILSRCDSSSVSLIREIRQATEGEKIKETREIKPLDIQVVIVDKNGNQKPFNDLDESKK